MYSDPNSVKRISSLGASPWPRENYRTDVKHVVMMIGICAQAHEVLHQVAKNGGVPSRDVAGGGREAEQPPGPNPS